MYLWLTKHRLLLKICFHAFKVCNVFKFLVYIRGNVWVSDISAILLCENAKKRRFASILTAWFYFVFAKKFDNPVRKYVNFMYQVASISKLLILISCRTDNLGGKIESFKMTVRTQQNLSKITRKLTITK